MVNHPHLSRVPGGGGGGDVDLLDEDDHHDSRVCFICFRGRDRCGGGGVMPGELVR